MDLARMVITITILLFVFIMFALADYVFADIPGNPNKITTATEPTGQDNSNTNLTDIRTTIGDNRKPSINPHWDKTKCNYCHNNDSSKPASNQEKANLDDALCLDCHEDDVTHSYIHPVGLVITDDARSRIDKQWNGELQLSKKGVMTCYTCHDLLDQCLADRSHQKIRNPSFLRGGPFPNRVSLCYRCHDSTQYERVNSHDQITKRGYLKLDKCRLCHEVDTRKHVKSGIPRDLIKYPLLNNMDDERTQLCIRCHRKIDHPSSAFTIKSNKKYRHLVRIDNNKKRSLKRMIEETGIELPIEPNTERIYCGTCHQPHQPGVFAGETQSDVTMDNHRLRTVDICKFCHEIYEKPLDSG
ncbi:MAG: hypothetical protein ABW092_13305 [Candidatus Thiodiazotropha sp.]